MGAWRDDPELAGAFHPQHPDDLQVLVHEGEPRRSGRAPEACWVRVDAVHGSLRIASTPAGVTPPIDPALVTWRDKPVYAGVLLNQPHGLVRIKQGARLLFLQTPGLPAAGIQVDARYLEERPGWAYVPCTGCGADQSLDPPSIMAQTRFPDAPAGALPIAFTAFCPCGGTLALTLVEHVSHPPPAPAAKPWWKIW